MFFRRLSKDYRPIRFRYRIHRKSSGTRDRGKVLSRDGNHARAICPAVTLHFLPILDTSANLNCHKMRVFLYMKHSASSHDPLEASNEDANLIRIEKSLPSSRSGCYLLCATGAVPARWGAYERRSKNPGGGPTL
jgi:hypothetical protein